MRKLPRDKVVEQSCFMPGCFSLPPVCALVRLRASGCGRCSSTRWAEPPLMTAIGSIADETVCPRVPRASSVGLRWDPWAATCVPPLGAAHYPQVPSHRKHSGLRELRPARSRNTFLFSPLKVVGFRVTGGRHCFRAAPDPLQRRPLFELVNRAELFVEKPLFSTPLGR